MRRVRGWLWVVGFAIVHPVAAGHAQEAPEAASGKAKANKSKVVRVDQPAQAPKPAALETPPRAAGETAKPAARSGAAEQAKPAAAPARPADDKLAGPAADKPAQPAASRPGPAAVPATAQNSKPKRPTKAEAELASARTAPAAPPPPPPAATPKAPPPQPIAAPKPAGPSCSLEEAEQPRGGRLDVLGSGFGQAPVVRIAARPARMIERRTDRISVQVPADSDGGAVTLQSEGQSASCGNLVIIGKNR